MHVEAQNALERGREEGHKAGYMEGFEDGYKDGHSTAWKLAKQDYKVLRRMQYIMVVMFGIGIALLLSIVSEARAETVGTSLTVAVPCNPQNCPGEQVEESWWHEVVEWWEELFTR